MDTLYIETSIISYATSWPSKNVQIAAIQEQARDWWRTERPKFELVTSQLTLDEAAAGDPIAAAERLSLLPYPSCRSRMMPNYSQIDFLLAT